MIIQYFIVALRNLRRQKSFALLNLLGMALGLACFGLFAIHGGTKLRADRFHRNGHRIYGAVTTRIEDNQAIETAFGPGNLLESLRESFPEMEDGVRFVPAGMMIQQGNKVFRETDVYGADPNFLSFFTFELVRGQPEESLSQPNSIVLTESAALKYFGDEDPIDRLLILGGRRVPVTVRGICRTLKRTSSMRFQFLVSMDVMDKLGVFIDNGSNTEYKVMTFVRLAKGTSPKIIQARLESFRLDFWDAGPEAPKKLTLFPLLDFRLHGGRIRSCLSSSHPVAVILVLGLGFILLSVVSINFTNLAVARAMVRVKEIGIRKMVGARRSQLVVQFMGESNLLALAAMPPGVLIYELLNPIIFSALRSPTGVSNSIWNYPFLLIYMSAASAITGFLSGIYPALTLSSFIHKEALQGRVPGKNRTGFRILLAIQFFVSILCMGMAVLFTDQMNQIVHADFGYRREGVAWIAVDDAFTRNRLQQFLETLPGIEGVSAAVQSPVLWSNSRSMRLPEKTDQESLPVDLFGVDYGFVSTMRMEMVQGRDFLEGRDRDGWIINEMAAKKMGLESPLGKFLVVDGKPGRVIGVVKDFLFGDVVFEMPPAVLRLEPDALGVVLFRFNPSTPFAELESRIKTRWMSIAPDQPFECKTLDRQFDEFFDIAHSIMGLMQGVGALTMFFSCLGLLGLVAVTVERHSKEIGIRKVLGASVSQVVWTLGRSFSTPVLAAMILAFVLLHVGWKLVLQTGLLFMRPIPLGLFFMTSAMALVSSGLAIGVQTVRAALSNPIEALRYE